MHYPRQSILIILVLWLISPVVLAEQTPTVDELTAIFQETIPTIELSEVNPSPIPGLYEVVSGSQVFYSTADGSYLIQGNLLDITTSPPTNLTELKNQSIRLAAINELDASSMIVFPAKNETEGQITVFTDTTCPYCSRLHNEVKELNDNGIEVRYIAFPRAGQGSPAYNTAVSVWCSDDPQQALTDAKAGKSIPRSDECSEETVNQHLALVSELGLNVTPVIVLESGMTINGYIPAEQLIDIVREDKANHLSTN